MASTRNVLDIRVMSNRLPTIARGLGVATEEATTEAATFTWKRWVDTVRIDTSEYHDNIYIDRESKNSFIVASPTRHAYFNEFGSVTISADHAAQRAEEAGLRFYEKTLYQALVALLP